MLRPLALAMIFGLFSGVFGPAAAQSRPPEPSGERFIFQQTERGMMRLDSRTGQVSLCASASSGVTCRVIPDERAALESEIARLETENAALKKALADHSLTASPPPVPPASIPEVADKSPVPDARSEPEAAKGRIRTAIDTAWRNLVAMMSRMKGALQNAQ